jgi:hypothetical protein
MGGVGSGRWGWHTRKATVEDYPAIDIDALIRAGLFDHDTGMIEWESTNPTNRARHSFTYQLESSDVPTCRYLHLLQSNYRGETEKQVVTLLSRPQPLGGVRWYFFCPMWCSRRVRKLYLGGVGGWFGCRICRELTYTSAQTHDRQTAGFQRNPWLLRAALKAHWRLKFKAYKFVLAKHRRWWSKASAWSLTISGTS